jgi:aconitate hydratase
MNDVIIGKSGWFINGTEYIEDSGNTGDVQKQLLEKGIDINSVDLAKDKARTKTISYGILSKHNTSKNMENLQIRFDCMASHDITYVGIIQTARASGMEKFPLPYVLTNCHNSLCAVGGTINEDDHVFGLSAAKKYGGVFVPAHQAVIHQYMREMMSGCGKMILGSDSHTRYGALGTMAIGEGGPELAKQLLERTYDIAYPEVVAVYLEGAPSHGVGPQDVALAIIRAVFKNGLVKNKVMEFVGPSISGLSVDFRNGIDVMTTETTCLSSIWRTDAKVKEYFDIHGRSGSYAELKPGEVSYYDAIIRVNLSAVRPMIALPFHPSNAYTINELNANLKDIIALTEAEGQKQLDNPKLKFSLNHKIKNGRLHVDQGVVAGCSGGTFENIMEMTDITGDKNFGNGAFWLSVYPASQPINIELTRNGAMASLMTAGATFRTAFCGPCFGAGDVPANEGLSIRHTTRNFPNREGSKPSNGQVASVALMDARSIAATAINGGVLTGADEIDYTAKKVMYTFNKTVYENRIFDGTGKADTTLDLKFGPNIVDWSEMSALPENILLQFAAVIHDPVTTTDELIPSGEASSYRSNPLKLAEFTLSRKEPKYYERAKKVQELETLRRTGTPNAYKQIESVIGKILEKAGAKTDTIPATGFGSLVFARKPGDGSAREQAASCQKVLGGWANIAIEYATKRYRSNLINWGMIPFTIEESDIAEITPLSYLYIKSILTAMKNGDEEIAALIVKDDGVTPITLKLPKLTKDDRDIILAGGLINYYRK